MGWHKFLEFLDRLQEDFLRDYSARRLNWIRVARRPVREYVCAGRFRPASIVGQAECECLERQLPSIRQRGEHVPAERAAAAQIARRRFEPWELPPCGNCYWD